MFIYSFFNDEGGLTNVTRDYARLALFHGYRVVVSIRKHEDQGCALDIPF